MKRLLPLLPAMLLALGAPSATAAQSTAGAAVGDIDAFWANTLAAAGYAYQSPGVVALDAPQETACGVIDPAWGYAAYCPPDATVYYSVPWADALSANGDAFAVVTVLAHEWGHHIQFSLGLGYGGAESELQADCFAGAYSQDAVARGALPSIAIAEALQISLASGDAAFLPPDAPAHGSGPERALAFNRGYTDGLAGCGLAL